MYTVTGVVADKVDYGSQSLAPLTRSRTFRGACHSQDGYCDSKNSKETKKFVGKQPDGDGSELIAAYMEPAGVRTLIDELLYSIATSTNPSEHEFVFLIS